ncbi:MAG TPA: FKBP-type peptidyl-prolyl cis-trans isomerase [Thermoanaerobaculia bacterium]|nr:FKBP-type peptidyl-prolyl cis-trans isomerase [Thermoanaerobaculia bacterium]
MQKSLTTTALLLVVSPLLAAPPPKASPAAAKPSTASSSGELKTDEEKTMYAIGLVISRNLGPFTLTDHELELVKMGLADGVHKTPKVPIDVYGPKVNELAKQRSQAAAATEKKAGEGFLAKAGAEKGAVKKPSGLVFLELKAGSGPTPKPTDSVKVNYRGTLTDGTEFDSSYKRNEPASFRLDQVVPCWTEGVQLMKVGGKARLTCPAAIAYGDAGSPPLIKPGATLIFEVELLEIAKPK